MGQLVNTSRRYLVKKTKCTCIRNTQCLPWRMSLLLLIDQTILSPCNASKPLNMNFGQQQRHMRRFAGSCRFVFNKALALQKANHEVGGKFIGYVARAKELTAWRNGSETPWLKDAPVHPLQHALKDLDQRTI